MFFTQYVNNGLVCEEFLQSSPSNFSVLTHTVMPVSAEVMEENLRQTIREEMQRSLEEVLDKRRQELQLQ